jgi:hypothetical protein
MKIVRFLASLLIGIVCLFGLSFIILAVIGLIKYIW